MTDTRPRAKIDASSVVTTAQAAEIAGVSIATINRWAETGRLPVALKAPGVRGARMFHRHNVEQAATRTA